MVIQDYDIDQGSGWYRNQVFGNAIKKYQPSMEQQINAQLERFLIAGQSNPIHYAGRIVANALDESAEISKDEWETHPSKRDGLDWFEGMTELQAELDADQIDREVYYSEYMKNTDQWAAHNVATMVGTALFDPLTYVPFMGITSKLGAMGSKLTKRFQSVSTLSQTAVSPANSSFISKTLTTISSPLKPVAIYAGEAGFAEATFQMVKGAAENNKDSDYIAAMTDIGIATLAGGILGTVPMARKLKSQFSDTQLGEFLGKNINDFKQWGESRWNGTGSKSPKQFTKEEAEAEWNQKQGDVEAAIKAEQNKALHPITEYVKELGGDVYTGTSKLLDKFFGCKFK